MIREGTRRNAKETVFIRGPSRPSRIIFRHPLLARIVKHSGDEAQLIMVLESMFMERQPEDTLHVKAMAVYDRLVAAQGYRELVPRREPMHELISTMLSHRTTEQNEALAYSRMWERFGAWEAIRDAPVEELADAIAPSNFAEAKAPNIKKVLARIIDERGEPSIDFLQDLPAEEGLAWLMSLPGVGIKTATLVLLFCFAKPVLPVDTHVHRVSQRVGLIGSKVNPTAAHPLLMALLPHDAPVLFNFHVALLRHGQKICVWSDPRCKQCPLTDLCDWYAEHRQGDAARSSNANTKPR